MAEHIENIENGLLGISISDSEDSAAESKTQSSEAREARTAQSEEAWQAVKETYKVKVENGDIYKTIHLPLPKDIGKLEAREVLYAVEELYFFRRFAEAAGFLAEVFRDGAEGLDGEVRGTLEYYRKKCQEKGAEEPSRES